MLYMPSELIKERERLKAKKRLYERLRDKQTLVNGLINKLEIDIKNYDEAIEILKNRVMDDRKKKGLPLTLDSIRKNDVRV